MAGVGGADTGQSELLGASFPGPVLALDHLNLPVTSFTLPALQSQPTRLASTFSSGIAPSSRSEPHPINIAVRPGSAYADLQGTMNNSCIGAYAAPWRL
jgi:hypothetical protein